ncbi:MAG: stage V sporulation protein AB [Defluviitaleaceae bacterium]|nr:stage V sporulation protein AB [Defluviitaleaceae bacterium]
MAELAVLKHVISVVLGFSSGLVIAGAVFAFITVVGVVPRLAQKTGTQTHYKIYESSIAVGGILGTIIGFTQIGLPVGIAGAVILVIMSLCIGIFYGCLAMSLAEVLDVIPILTRRGRVQRGLFFFVLAIALGKLIGSLLYFLVSGFHEPGAM